MGALSDEEVAEVERLVNEAIWVNNDVCISELPYQEAIDRGAMALFSEKYADVVRVIDVPGVSMELCGGTHVRSTGQIGLFRIVSETGVAAGVRRIEAVTGREAYRRLRETDELIRAASSRLRTREDNLLGRLDALLEEGRELTRQLARARSSAGGDVADELIAAAPMWMDCASSRRP